LLAIVGIGGAAFVAYRRQATTELTYQFTVRAHAVAIDAQTTATRQLELDSQKYELDRQRHELDTQRRHDDRVHELRARFSTIAQQLGAEHYAVRHAGVFALASLADDWHRAANDIERQACVDLFCAQLRSHRVPEPTLRNLEAGIGPTMAEYRQDTEIRKAMVALLRSHRPLSAVSEDNWKSCSLDLSGADLSLFYLDQTDLRGVNLDGANLTYTSMIGTDLSDAMMARVNITNANFDDATMVDAKLYSARIDDSTDEKRPWSTSAKFNNANLEGAWFTNARLPHSEFDGANLTGAKMDFTDLQMSHFVTAILSIARLRNAKLVGANFGRADLGDAQFSESDLNDARFDQARYNERTKWPNKTPPQGIGPPETPESGSDA